MSNEANRSVFTALSEIDCGDKKEKKGNFTYLSWTWAISKLQKEYPEATWDVHEFQTSDENGTFQAPYMKTPHGLFVKVSATVGGITRTHTHPVLDNKNNQHPKPTSKDINNSIMRCIVKAIALHGLGLYIYAGEDLPEISEETEERLAAEEAEKEKKQAAHDYDVVVRAGEEIENASTPEAVREVYNECRLNVPVISFGKVKNKLVKLAKIKIKKLEDKIGFPDDPQEAIG